MAAAGRALSVQPSLPSWWLEEALAAEGKAPDAPALEDEVAADVAIVGGGYTGLWTALALRELDPSVNVVVLEADLVGYGPSGRNGGFLHGYWSLLARLREAFGDDGALEVARTAAACIPAVRALAESQNADVWLHEAPMLRVSAAPAQDEAVERAVRTARELGVEEEAVRLTAEELRARCDSPSFRRGVLFREGATVQPARLARALRRAVLAGGVPIHERTPVLRLRRGSPNVLETRRGRVRAGEVVVAINAAAAAWRPTARKLTNFGSYIVLTEPVPELLDEIRWTGHESILDGRMFVHYFRTTDDGRVAMGSGSGPIGFGGRIDGRFNVDEPSAARAAAGLRFLLPALADVQIERAWGGPIDVSADRMPFFGTVAGTRIHYGAGYTGHGVGPSWLGGQILARLALGIDDELTRLPLVNGGRPQFPPEPVKGLGGAVVRGAALRVEEAEQSGRRAPAPLRAVAALPQLIGLGVGTR